MEEFGIGIDPEIVKQFEGKWIRMRTIEHRGIIALLKKAGDRSALFISPTKQIEFSMLYEDIINMATHSGGLHLPDGEKVVVNGVLKEDATKSVI